MSDHASGGSKSHRIHPVPALFGGVDAVQAVLPVPEVARQQHSRFQTPWCAHNFH